jgi:hypothetical protein
MSSHRRNNNHFIEIMSSDDEGDDDLLLGRGSVFSRPLRAVSGGGGQSTEAKASSSHVTVTTRTPPPSALPSSSSFRGTAARSGSGNGAAAAAAAATFTASSAAAAAATATVTTPTSLVHTTPIGFVDFDYVSNETKGSPGDAVIINRERDVRWIRTVDALALSAHRSHSFSLPLQSPIPNVVEVLLAGTRAMCGVIDHDEARLLAPILDRCFPDKLTCHGIIVSNHSHPKVVRVHFQAQSSVRRISKFELQPIERQIKYYLKGRKALVPETANLTPPPVTPGSALAAAKGTPAGAGSSIAGAPSDENRLNAAAAAVAATPAAGAHPSSIHVGDWTCFVSLTSTLATAQGATVELVRELDNVRTASFRRCPSIVHCISFAPLLTHTCQRSASFVSATTGTRSASSTTAPPSATFAPRKQASLPWSLTRSVPTSTGQARLRADPALH